MASNPTSHTGYKSFSTDKFSMEAQSSAGGMQPQLYKELMGSICAVIGKSGFCYLGRLKDEDGALLHLTGVKIAPPEYVQVPYTLGFLGPESNLRVRLRSFYGNEAGVKSIPEMPIRKENVESIFGLPTLVRSEMKIPSIDLQSAMRKLIRYLQFRA